MCEPITLVMRPVAFFLLGILTLILKPAFAADLVMRGDVGKQSFEVRYRDQSKEVRVDFLGVTYSFSVTGYAVANVLVRDMDGDGNDEVMFLDYAGVSVGGDLRVLRWSGKAFEEVGNSYFTSSLEVPNVGKSRYLALIQHDTGDLNFVDKVLILDGAKIQESASREVWEKIIGDYYQPSLSKTADDWALSRYNSYIAMAYGKARESWKAVPYWSSARTLDSDNPFLKAANEPLAYAEIVRQAASGTFNSATVLYLDPHIMTRTMVTPDSLARIGCQIELRNDSPKWQNLIAILRAETPREVDEPPREVRWGIVFHGASNLRQEIYFARYYYSDRAIERNLFGYVNGRAVSFTQNLSSAMDELISGLSCVK